MIISLIVLHFLLGAGIVAAGDRLGRRGFALGTLGPVATAIWLFSNLGTIVNDGKGGAIVQRIDWAPTLGLTFDLRVDAFAAVMLALISVIGVAVCVYAVAYFGSDKPGIGRLSGLLVMFSGAMTGVVVSDHLLALFVFWELTSVTSYLLIGNDDTNPRARDAATSAILITGAGGLAMLAGLVVLGQSAGTYRFSELASAFASTDVSPIGFGAIVLILLGAFTKSAQWPFSSWLPGAMVAPTPISTYLHAATMVKAECSRCTTRTRHLQRRRLATHRVHLWCNDNGVWRLASTTPGRSQSALGVRNGEPTRVHDDARRCWHVLAHPSPRRRPTRPRSVQSRSLHGRWRG